MYIYLKPNIASQRHFSSLKVSNSLLTKSTPGPEISNIQMDLFELLKESVPKRDKLKQLIVAHTGLSPPAFVVAVTAGAATVAAITCYFKSTCCAATDCDTEIGSNGMEDSG